MNLQNLVKGHVYKNDPSINVKKGHIYISMILELWQRITCISCNFFIFDVQQLL